jgi:hypothetical protein
MSDALVAVGREWFARDSVELAPLLLGAVLAHDTEEGRVAIRLSRSRRTAASARIPARTRSAA